MKSQHQSNAASQQPPVSSLPVLDWVYSVLPALRRAADDLGVVVSLPKTPGLPKWAHLTPCPVCQGKNDPHAVATVDLTWDKSTQELSLHLRCSDDYCDGYDKDGLPVDTWAPDYLRNRWPVPDPIPLGSLSVARARLSQIVCAPHCETNTVTAEGVPMGVGKTRATVIDVVAEVAAGGSGGTYYAPRHDELSTVGEALRARGVEPYLLEGSSRTIGPEAGPWAEAGVPAGVILPRESSGRHRKKNQPVLAAHQVINEPAPWVSGIKDEAGWSARRSGKKNAPTPSGSLPGPARVDEQPGFIRRFEIKREHLELVMQPFTDPDVESWASTRRDGIDLLLTSVLPPLVSACCAADHRLMAAGKKKHSYSRVFDAQVLHAQVGRLQPGVVHTTCKTTLPLMPREVFCQAWTDSFSTDNPSGCTPASVRHLATMGWIFLSSSMPVSDSLQISTRPGDEWPHPAIDELLRAVFQPDKLMRQLTVHLSIDTTGAQPKSKFCLSYLLGDELPDGFGGKVLDGTAPLGAPAYEAAFAPRPVVVNNYGVTPDHPDEVRRVLIRVGHTAFSRMSLIAPGRFSSDLRPRAVASLVRVFRAAAHEVDKWIVPRLGGPAKFAWIVPKPIKAAIEACVAQAWGRASTEQVVRVKKCGAQRLVNELKWHIAWGALAEVKVGCEYAVHGSNDFEDCHAILTFKIRPNLGKVWMAAQVLAVNPVGYYRYLAESIVAQHEERIRVLTASPGSPRLALHASSSAPAWWGDDPFNLVALGTGRLPREPGQAKVADLFRDLLEAHGAVAVGLIDWIADHPDAYVLAFGHVGQALHQKVKRVAPLRQKNRHADLAMALNRPGKPRGIEHGYCAGRMSGRPWTWNVVRASAREKLVEWLDDALNRVP